MEKVVTALMRGGVTPAQIGVITPYEGQRAHVLTTMLRVCQTLYPKSPKSWPPSCGCGKREVAAFGWNIASDANTR